MGLDHAYTCYQESIHNYEYEFNIPVLKPEIPKAIEPFKEKFLDSRPEEKAFN